MVDCQLGVGKWEILFRRTARVYLGRCLDNVKYTWFGKINRFVNIMCYRRSGYHDSPGLIGSYSQEKIMN